MKYPINFYIFTLETFMLRTVTSMVVNSKCRGGIYPRSNVTRFPVPDEKVEWSVPYDGYNPPYYSSPSIEGKPWADRDLDNPDFKPRWNSLDGNVNRTSYTGPYKIENGYPLNPKGRTGIKGRGVLGRWGPNHAADPVVTRWKILPSGVLAKNNHTERPILQFVAVKRRDNGEWALPGGMVDPGEKVAAAALREFQEEATNSLLKTDDEKAAWKTQFDKFFSTGEIVYKGYVDDPRNTDNAWMETVAYNFHDENGSLVGSLKLHAGDDAVGVRWVDVSKDLILYASHRDILEAVAIKRNAMW